uniref:General negative regulator of transcription subunit 4 n=1 Tax=Anthurium amnicola TaxID=1678845 RepID=A0A1D1XHX2_9ARAE
MGLDAAMANTSAPGVPAVSRDAGGKKKRNNRSAKLKQCKLDARREQWLSQLKNKGCEVANEHALPPAVSPLPLSVPLMRKPDGPLGTNSPEVMPRREDSNGTTGLHDSDMDSPMNSPTSSVSGNNSSGKDFPSCSISSGSYSRSVSDADEEEGEGSVEEGRDDWEAVADALTANDGRRSHQNPEHVHAVPGSTGCLESRKGDGILEKPELARIIPRAWSPDDVFRPQSLPNLSKQRSFPLNLERYCNQGTMVRVHHGSVSQASSCPICYEDLDLTDSSFLPCSCGFHLCLFCHKRILETDGRCPGCRKQYSQMGNGDNGLEPMPTLNRCNKMKLSICICQSEL